jgi:hypothetical protein
MKIFLPILMITQIALSKCLLNSDKDKAENSKIIFIGKITRTSNSQSPDFHCQGIGANSLPLKYLIEPIEVLKGELVESVVELKYAYVCNKFPKIKIFTNGKKYIFSMKMKRKRQIYLGGLTCGSWGWNIKDLKKVKATISK